MRNRVAGALVIAVAATAAYVALSGTGEAERPIQRPAPRIPDPRPPEDVAYFFRLFISGEQTEIGGKRIPTWQRIGERTLMEMGEPALDYLLAPERFRTYRTSPNLVANLLRMLPSDRDALKHRRLYPFLLHYLDPGNCPPVTPGNDWVSAFRKAIFAIFTYVPDARAVPACIDELDRKTRVHDLRREAVMVLLRVGETGPLKKRYAGFPLEMKIYFVARIYEFAHERLPQKFRETAREFEPELRAGLDSENVAIRIQSAAGLLRLGDETMVDRLLEEFERAMNEGLENPAWTAMTVLAENRQDPRVYRVCRDALEGKDELARSVAHRLLRQNWIDEKEIQDLLWKEIQASDPALPLDPRPLLALLRVDRPKVLGFLKKAILGDNLIWRASAIDFSRTKRAVAEAGPWIAQLVPKERDPRQRAALYGALAALGTTSALPLMRVELEDTDNDELRGVAAVALIEFGDAEGIAMVAERLEGGDTSLLPALQRHALAQGRAGVPEALLPGLLRAVHRCPGEEERLSALFILRCRGSMEGVREALVDAYRREPSRRVANQIETTLVELAHR